MRSVHDCSCRCRCLAAAFFALVHFTSGKVDISGGAAMGTLPAVLPNDFKEAPVTGIVIGITAFEVVKGGVVDHQHLYFLIFHSFLFYINNFSVFISQKYFYIHNFFLPVYYKELFKT
jgi:hypothetical protein